MGLRMVWINGLAYIGFDDSVFWQRAARCMAILVGAAPSQSIDEDGLLVGLI